MAFTEIYVDPSRAADVGTGTIGDPFGDLEYAIEQTTFDTTNGTRVNIKAGTDEVLAAELSAALENTVTTVAWVPSITAPCIFQGYTTAAGDGGQGGISGGGSVSIYNDVSDNYIHFIDLHLHNTGANNILNLNDQCSVIRCELNNATGNAIEVDTGATVSQNYIYDVQGVAISIGSLASVVKDNYIKDGTKKFTSAIRLALGSIAYRNIIQLDGGGIGIESVAYTSVINNSVFTSGTGLTGINQATNESAQVIANNLVEGFATGIKLDQSGAGVRQYGGNAVYNASTAAYTSPSVPALFSLGDNETLTASPFTDAANGDFSPVNTGNVKEGSLPAIIGGGLV